MPNPVEHTAMPRAAYPLQAALVRVAYGQLTNVVISSVLVATLVALVFVERTPLHFAVGCWLALSYAHSAARYVLGRMFAARPVPDASTVRWHHVLVLVSLLSGVIWAALPVLAFAGGDSIAISVVTWSIAGLVAGAAQSHAASMLSFAAAAMPMISSLALCPLFVSNAGASPHLAALAVLYGILITRITWNNHRALAESVALRFENLELLSQVTAERNRAVTARLEAERASAAKTQFLAAASHDLRQPMHAQSLFLETLRSRCQDPEAEYLVGRAQAAAGALQELLDALLDVSRLDAGALSVDPCALPVAPLMQHIQRTFEPLAYRKALSLRVVHSDLWVTSDRDVLTRILGNLVSNAVRYTSRGGVLLSCRRRGRMARFEVWDTGIGIPSSKREEIFLEFRQLDNPERDRTKGIGLGLAIVNRLAKLIDTKVEVRSVVGRGSVFSFDLVTATPAHVAGVARYERLALPTGRGDAAQKRRRRVLVIDDDSMAREAMAGLLGSWGFQVSQAGSVEEATRESLRAPIDLIVADYRLRQGTTGVDAIRSVARTTSLEVAAVLVTGDTAPQRIQDAHAAGYPVLHKPVRAEQLQEVLQRLLGSPSSSLRDTPQQ
jgi:two-component system, sensor histidine kinase